MEEETDKTAQEYRDSLFTRPPLCGTCKKPLASRTGKVRKGKLFCSSTCAGMASGYRSKYPGVSSGTVGAISELRAAVDLLSKGYEVFRSVSQSCSCDLAVLKSGKLIRVEVRTGYESRTGNITFPRNPRDEGRSDCYAIVLPNRIEYRPKLPDGEMDPVPDRESA